MALPVSVRSSGITVVIVALCSACSSKPSVAAKPEPNTPAGRHTAGLARKAKAKDEALLFVSNAQNACRELTLKTAVLTATSTINFTELDSFVPTELYPTDAFAAYVDDAAFGEVKSKLTELLGSVVELVRSLEHNTPTAATHVAPQPDEVIKDRAAFQDKKLKTLASITTYCESIRRAGAGVVPLQ